MILYINGDSHSAAGEAVNDYCFAEDDPKYFYMGRAPHPDNLKVSYGAELGKLLKAKLKCDAESASSNDRIIRTTEQFLTLPSNDKIFIIIGWSTWEREEWHHEGRYWQVNAGGIGEDWPDAIKDRYKPWVAGLDMNTKMVQEHDKIFNFHKKLKDKGIKHLFFNSYEALTVPRQVDWGNNYINPYDKNFTYYNWAIANGHKPVNPDSYHFGARTHFEWAQYLVKHLTKLL